MTMTDNDDGPMFDLEESVAGLREIAAIRRENHDRISQIVADYAPLPGKQDDLGAIINPLLPSGSVEEQISDGSDPSA